MSKKTFRLISRQSTPEMGVMPIGNPLGGGVIDFLVGEEGYYCAEVDAAVAAKFESMSQTTIHVLPHGDDFPWEVKTLSLEELKQIAKTLDSRLIPLFRRHAESEDNPVAMFSKDMVVRLEGLDAPSPFAPAAAAKPTKPRKPRKPRKPAAKKPGKKQ